MIRVQSVSNLDGPELAPYKTMRFQLEHRQKGIFVAEGEKVVRRLIESDYTIVSLLLPEKWAEIYLPLLEDRNEDIAIFTADKTLLESLTGFTMYQGVLAVAKVPAPTSLDDLLENSPDPKLFMAVDSISNSQNLGGLIRNCVAFGVHGLIVGETCCSAFLRRSVRSSMGTIFKLKIVETDSLLGSIRQLRQHRVQIIAAHPHTQKKLLHQAHFERDCCILLGSEGEGINPEILSACDEAVAVAMQNAVDSLNVGTAGAVFLYEADRQRRLAKNSR